MSKFRCPNCNKILEKVERYEDVLELWSFKLSNDSKCWDYVSKFEGSNVLSYNCPHCNEELSDKMLEEIDDEYKNFNL